MFQTHPASLYRYPVVPATLVTALIASIFAAGPAYAETTEARHSFTNSNPSYSITDGNGTFTAQGRPSAPSGNTMAWSHRVSPYLQSIATGNRNCTAGHMQLPYHDTHNGPITYLWHSSVPGNRVNTNYTLWGSCTFRVAVNGRPGTATLSFNFRYVFSNNQMLRIGEADGSTDPGGNEYSTLKIAWDD